MSAPPAPSLDLLRTFLAVYRAGSMTAAATALALAQPTVTAQIRTLERDLGRALFTRLARGVAPTPAADDLAQRVAGPLDELAAAVTTADGQQDRLTGRTVYLAGPAEFTAAVVVPSLAPLLRHGLTARIRFGLPDPLLDALTNRNADLVVTSTRPRRPGIVAEPLYDEEFILVATPEWAQRLPAADLDQHGPEILRKVPILAYADNLPIIRRYWRHVFGVPRGGNAALVAPDLRAVLAATIAGAGISVLPHYLCRESLAHQRLTILHTPSDPPINTLWLARLPTADAVAHVAAVRDHLLASAPRW
ncbi:LysR family transcriptional regulator [Frankia sp. AgB1.8]|nr:LysR family transcriptional regulator [Frankia sp. AgB1.8]